MEEENYYEEYDIDLKALFTALWAGKKTIMIGTLVMAVLGLIVAFSLPKQYRVTTVVAPELRMNKSSLGSLGALTSMAGLSSSMLNSTEAMYPDLYPKIVGSTPFLTDLFTVPVTVSTKQGPVQTDLKDYMLNYQKAPWWGPVIGFPMKLAHKCMDIFRKKPEARPSGAAAVTEGGAEGGVVTYRLSEEEDAAAKAINGSIKMEVDKKTALITIVIVTQDPDVSANLMNNVLSRLQNYVTSYRTEKARHDLEYMQGLKEEARTSYVAAQQRFARYVDANQNIVLLRVKAEQDRLQSEMNLAYQIYMQTSQQEQMAKAKVQESTPVFVVIQPSTVPTRPCKPSKTMILAVALFLGFCLSSAWVLIKNSLKKEETEE